MKKIIRLFHIQLWSVMGDMLSIGNSVRKKPKGIYSGILVFAVVMSCVSYFYSYMIGTGLKMFDSIEILPALMMAVTCLVVLVTTTFKIKGTLFGFKDYDMVMSLPVSTAGVAASRLMILYAVNAMFVLILIVPMMIAYGVLMTPSPMFYILGLLIIFFIPLIPIVAASVLGTIIAYAASKFRHSNLLNIIFTMVIILAFMGFSFTIKGNGQELADMGKAMAALVNSIYPLAGLYTRAIVNYDIAAFLIFIAVSLLAFLLYTAVIQFIFKKMNTVMMTGSYRRNFKLREVKTSSPLKALYLKELKRYFASPMYVVNTGFGVVMLTIGAIALLFVDAGQILGNIPGDAVTVSGPMFLTFCVVLTSTTMASISLEGKNLWILKSLPIEVRTIFHSKMAVNLTVLALCLPDAILIGIGLKMTVPQTLLMVLMTVVCSLFVTFYGLLINLQLPNLNWVNEVVVVKQSAASMTVVFSGLGVVLFQFTFFFLIPSALLALLLFIVLMAVADVILYRVLLGYGVKKFNEL